MKIKKFLAESLKEGKDRIIEELGDEAIILSSRVFKNPQNGADAYEIVAGIDETIAPKKNQATPKPPISKSRVDENPSKLLQQAIFGDKSNDKFIQYFETLNEKINELNEYVKYKYSGSLGGIFSDFYKILRRAEFDDEFALKITSTLYSIGKFNNINELVSEARRIISSDIPLKNGLKKGIGRSVSILIGPTGSGKTTTLVKMAVMAKISFNANVLIVSADTYKVGGSEQLQTFASIAGIPYIAAYSASELRGLLSKESNYDFILIDTVGISPRVKEHLQNLEEIVKSSKADNIFLVQSATSSTNNFKFVLKNFLKFGINGLILTKVDEIESIAPLVGFLSTIDLPLAYITNGQRIPQDIELASRSYLSKILIPDSFLIY
ncbi:MAG TPA: hypothetical protein PLE30_04110 [Candidatus Kapabacteria bacterium]|nr:hypothetical protein [Candidatus Kapabacteria bacterium]